MAHRLLVFIQVSKFRQLVARHASGCGLQWEELLEANAIAGDGDGWQIVSIADMAKSEASIFLIADEQITELVDGSDNCTLPWGSADSKVQYSVLHHSATKKIAPEFLEAVCRQATAAVSDNEEPDTRYDDIATMVAKGTFLPAEHEKLLGCLDASVPFDKRRLEQTLHLLTQCLTARQARCLFDVSGVGGVTWGSSQYPSIWADAIAVKFKLDDSKAKQKDALHFLASGGQDHEWSKEYQAALAALRDALLYKCRRVAVS